MKTFKILVALLFLAGSAHAEVSAEKRQEIGKLLRVTGVSSLAEQMMTQVIASLRTNMPNVPAEFWTRFQAKMDLNDLLDRFIPVYDRHYSLAELRSINAFYETPAGKKLITTMPILMQEGAKIGQQWGTEIGQAAVREAMLVNGGKSPAQSAPVSAAKP